MQGDCAINELVEAPELISEGGQSLLLGISKLRLGRPLRAGAFRRRQVDNHDKEFYSRLFKNS